MRPVSLTVATVLLAIVSVVALGILFSSGSLAPEARAQMGSPLLIVVAAAFGLVCCVGFWRMKKWAVIAYSAVSVVPLVVMGISFTTQIPVAIAVLGLMNWSELR